MTALINEKMLFHIISEEAACSKTGTCSYRITVCC